MWSVAYALALAACAGPEAMRAPEDNGTRVVKAVTTPLSDLNLLREKIPAVLLAAREAPYRMPGVLTCVALVEEIRELDQVLGPDLDATSPEASGLLERGSVAVGQAAFDALRGAAEGLLPYRSWIRKLTGAERHSREVAAAIAAGIVRRAYLKGVGQHLGCEAPAAPLPAEAAD